MKMILSEYVEDLGMSIVALRKGEEIFEGTTYLAEEDLDVESSYAGCQFAEIKAMIKALKWQYREARKEIKTLENLYIQMTQLKYFEDEKHSQCMQHLRKQIKIKKRKAEEFKDNYTYLQNVYPVIVEARLNASREIMAKVNKNENK